MVMPIKKLELEIGGSTILFIFYNPMILPSFHHLFRATDRAPAYGWSFLSTAPRQLPRACRAPEKNSDMKCGIAATAKSEVPSGNLT